MKRVILWIVKNERHAAENVTQFELLKKEYDDVVVGTSKKCGSVLEEMPSNMKLVSVVIEAAPNFSRMISRASRSLMCFFVNVRIYF